MKIPIKAAKAMATKKDDTNEIKPTARRGRAIKSNACVGSACSIIETNFGLPEGSVRLVLPSGKNARRDKSIGALLRDWMM